MKNLLLVLVLLLFVSETFQDDSVPDHIAKHFQCGENQVLKMGSKSINGCDASCPTPPPTSWLDVKRCTLMYGPGCDCRDGYLRNLNHECVLPSEC